jgi:histidyl-tRNA synthetase
LNALISLGTPSIKTQMKKANRLGATYVAIIGIMEAKNGICQLKNMELGAQREVRLDELIPLLVSEVDKKELDFYSPMKDFVIEDIQPPVIE